MPKLRRWVGSSIFLLGTFTLAVQAEDLHFKKNISVGGNSVSSSEVWVKGARERSVNTTPGGNVITVRQCDLKRTLTINDQTKSYLIANDPEDDSASKAASMFGGAPAAPGSGGTITQTTTVIDTGERKQISGYAARHLKMTVAVQSSTSACSKVSQKYEVDGWYADLAKAPSSCAASLPPVSQGEGCSDRIIVHHKGTGKPGYPLTESITVHSDDSTTTKIAISTSEITKQAAADELFDAPAGYHEVKSISELYGAPQVGAQFAANAPAQQAGMAQPSGMGAALGGNAGILAQSQQMAVMQQGMATTAQFQGGMGGMQGSPTGAAVPLPQALGPKAPGKIRIGVAPAQAQLGQGNSAQDYGTPVRNSIVLMMNGPAVEIAALDARIPIQLQAEAQQKLCDYILYSSVTVKHGGGSFGKFMKVGSMAANMNPMVAMTKSVGAMAASQAASQAAAMTAQQQAVNQLANFNEQIKSKDDVTVDYQLFPTGQVQPKLQNSLKGKAKSDGEDVLTPLIQQTATAILTDVTKK
jgi:hypothetical protein